MVPCTGAYAKPSFESTAQQQLPLAPLGPTAITEVKKAASGALPESLN